LTLSREKNGQTQQFDFANLPIRLCL
jgi:hypothetical protein